jgi:uncharacterized membrane protein YgcG
MRTIMTMMMIMIMIMMVMVRMMMMVIMVRLAAMALMPIMLKPTVLVVSLVGAGQNTLPATVQSGARSGTGVSRRVSAGGRCSSRGGAVRGCGGVAGGSNPSNLTQ